MVTTYLSAVVIIAGLLGSISGASADGSYELPDAYQLGFQHELALITAYSLNNNHLVCVFDAFTSVSYVQPYYYVSFSLGCVQVIGGQSIPSPMCHIVFNNGPPYGFCSSPIGNYNV